MDSLRLRGVAAQIFVIGICVSASFICRATEFQSWDGLQTSVMNRARGGAGVTSPITDLLPDWAKRKTVDSGWVSENPALASSIHEYAGRLQPLVFQSGGAGEFSNIEANQPSLQTTDAVRASLAGHENEIAESNFNLGIRYFERGISGSFFYSKLRRARLDTDGTLDFRAYSDFSAQIAASGPVFDKPRVGRLDFGTGLKAVWRKGDEIRQISGASSQNLTGNDLRKGAFAGGLDYGVLYSFPRNLLKDWSLQVALVWKDVGSTQFFVGNSTSLGKRFDAFPNNEIFGLGVGTPNILGGTRASLRVEYREWKRQISFAEKLVWGAEVRLPEVLSFSAGLRGSMFSYGAQFRFTNFELELAQASELVGEGDTKFGRRSFLMELKSVF